MKSAVVMICCICAVSFCGYARAQVFELQQVPGGLPVALKRRLSETRHQLADQLHELRGQAERFNSTCATVPADSPQVQQCQAGESELQGRRAEFNRRAERYNREVMRAGELSARSAVVWSAHGKVTLTRRGETSSAVGQNLENGDCIDVGVRSNAELILPQFTDVKIETGERFCYSPHYSSQQPDAVIGVLGYLYHWQNGHKVREPVEVAGVRG